MTLYLLVLWLSDFYSAPSCPFFIFLERTISRNIKTMTMENENNNKEKMSAVKRTALTLLDELKGKIVNDCDDDDVLSTLTKFHPHANGYFRQEDFVTADKAMSILHLGSNRKKFFQLVKDYGIVNRKISNQNVGFLRKDIERLCDILDVEIKEMEFKENKKKKGQKWMLW